jgi:hypothetical protein
MVADGVSIVSRRNQGIRNASQNGFEKNLAAQWTLRRPLKAAARSVTRDAARRSGDGSAAALHPRPLANLQSRGRPSFRAARRVRKRDGESHRPG